jgi:transcriptional regulator with PAS, ATPase and Fis domain
MRLNQNQGKDDFSERDILYKVLFDMKKDMSDLKRLVADIIKSGDDIANYADQNPQIINSLYRDIEINTDKALTIQNPQTVHNQQANNNYSIAQETDVEEVEESLSLIDKEADMIKKALKKHKGKRKSASEELGISERTLYRKIKELNLD